MKKKKDILFLLQFFYPEYISSATLPYDTAKKLVKQGYDVDVLCGYPQEYLDGIDVPRKENIHGISVRRVKYIQLDRKKAIGRIVNYLSLTIAMFFRIFSMRKYKAIFVYSNPPILPLVASIASKLFKCKMIFVAYDLYPEIALRTNSLSKDGIITKTMNYINKTVYKNSSAVVALSSEMKSYIVANRNIVPEKVHVIPNWYKDEYQAQVDNLNNVFMSTVSGRFTIGYFGNMGIAQDMEPLKAAIRHYKNDSKVCFLLSGHGSKHSEIKNMIETEKISNVYLFGFLKGQEYLDALRISDCAIVSLEKGLTGLCVPSKTYGYMMQGIPIVAIMDESDIVRDCAKGAGYYIKDNSSQEFIELISKIKNNKIDLQIKSEACRRIYLDNYTPEKCLTKYVKLISELDGLVK